MTFSIITRELTQRVVRSPGPSSLHNMDACNSNGATVAVEAPGGAVPPDIYLCAVSLL